MDLEDVVVVVVVVVVFVVVDGGSRSELMKRTKLL
jgi:hypothetical protein